MSNNDNDHVDCVYMKIMEDKNGNPIAYWDVDFDEFVNICSMILDKKRRVHFVSVMKPFPSKTMNVTHNNYVNTKFKEKE